MRPILAKKSHKNNSVDDEQAMRESSIFSSFGGICEPKVEGSYNNSKICICEESIGINAPNIRFNTHSKYAVRFQEDSKT